MAWLSCQMLILRTRTHSSFSVCLSHVRLISEISLQTESSSSCCCCCHGNKSSGLLLNNSEVVKCGSVALHLALLWNTFREFLDFKEAFKGKLLYQFFPVGIMKRMKHEVHISELLVQITADQCKYSYIQFSKCQQQWITLHLKYSCAIIIHSPFVSLTDSMESPNASK